MEKILQHSNQNCCAKRCSDSGDSGKFGIELGKLSGDDMFDIRNLFFQ